MFLNEREAFSGLVELDKIVIGISNSNERGSFFARG